jgi:plasmid stabilization system protein ParE
MALKVSLHRRAKSDLRSIRDYLLQHATRGSADRVREHLLERVRQLSLLPHIGRATSNPKIRVFSATRYPYVIYYTVKQNEVVILHFRHTSRSAPDNLPPLA